MESMERILDRDSHKTFNHKNFIQYSVLLTCCIKTSYSILYYSHVVAKTTSITKLYSSLLNIPHVAFLCLSVDILYLHSRTCHDFLLSKKMTILFKNREGCCPDDKEQGQPITLHTTHVRKVR
jgi:hypothetical protein